MWQELACLGPRDRHCSAARRQHTTALLSPLRRTVRLGPVEVERRLHLEPVAGAPPVVRALAVALPVVPEHQVAQHARPHLPRLDRRRVLVPLFRRHAQAAQDVEAALGRHDLAAAERVDKPQGAVARARKALRRQPAPLERERVGGAHLDARGLGARVYKAALGHLHLRLE
eukprot:5332880-Prymnesium_polylepis.1